MAKMDDLPVSPSVRQRPRTALGSTMPLGENGTKTFYQPTKLSASNDDAGTNRSTNNGDFAIAVVVENKANGLQRFLLVSFICSLIFPFKFYIGSLNFTCSRAYLTAVIIPILIYVLKNCRLGLPDALMFLYGTWAAVCIAVNQGFPAGLEPAGSHFIEVAGGYFLARAAIQTVEDFRYWAKLMFICLCVLFPAALAEFLTGSPVILDFLRKFMSVHGSVVMPTRMGFDRVQGVFDHPILYGVFCAGTFASSVLLIPSKSNGLGKYLTGLGVIVATFFSLSVGAYLNLLCQSAIVAWNRLLKSMVGRWKLLLGLGVLAYITIDILSNRTPFEVFISRFTFDINSSYTRVIQWKWGTAEVFRNPIFGMGLFTEWIRPDFVALSIDNFWLMRAMRYGFPGIILLVLLVAFAIRGAAIRTTYVDPTISAVSLAQLAILVGSCVSLMTVDVWSGSHVLFFFSIGATVSINGIREATHAVRN